MTHFSVDSFAREGATTSAPWLSSQAGALRAAWTRCPNLDARIATWVQAQGIQGPVRLVVVGERGPRVESLDGTQVLHLSAREIAPMAVPCQRIDTYFQHAVPSSPLSQRMQRAEMAANISSFGQNHFDWVADEEARHPVVESLGFVVAPIWVGAGIYGCSRAASAKRRATECGDTEGERQAYADGGAAGIRTVAGASALGVAVSHHFSAHAAAEAASSVLQHTASTLWGAGSIITAGIYFVKWRRCRAFAQEIETRLQDERLPKAARYARVLQFLRDAANVTDAERDALQASVPPTEFNKRVSELQQAKRDQLRRRCNLRSVRLILALADSLLAEPRGEGEWLARAEQVVDVVQSAANQKKWRYAAWTIAGLISFVAFLFGTFASFGTLPLILILISAGISILAAVVPAIWNQFAEPRLKRSLWEPAG